MSAKGLKTILIVDDDHFSQEALRLFLQKRFSTEVCDNGGEFFEILSKIKIDLILMDITLKGNKNGLELTQEIRKNKSYKHIPVICLTAHSRKVDKTNALSAGANVYLAKPVRYSKLLELINELIIE